MQGTAHVRSIESLDRLRVALRKFGEEVTGALDTADLELRRFVEWLESEQRPYWQHEIRRRQEQLAEAKCDLHRCLLATIDPEQRASCLQEKKIVERTKRQLDAAEEKLAAVRRWIPIVERAVMEYQKRATPLATAATTEVPRGAIHLDELARRLREYVETLVPHDASEAAAPRERTAEPANSEEPR